LNADGIQIDVKYCSTCTQCIAICPSQALRWDQTPARSYNRELLPTSQQLDELFKERRSIRRFKKDKISRPILEEIASYGAYAPTHNFSLRAIIVDDDQMINQLDRIMLDRCRWIYNLFYKNPLVTSLTGLFGYSDEFLKAKPKIEAALREGHAFHCLPTAFIFIVGDKRIPLSDASAQYALSQMMLYAQTKGVGTCLWGNAQLFIDKDKTARRALGLSHQERIFGGIYMGYPSIRYANKVEGKTFQTMFA
jgi:nitroreductase